MLKINGISARVSAASDKRYSLGVSSIYVYTQGVRAIITIEWCESEGCDIVRYWRWDIWENK